jgi:hypothetical protein
MVALRHQQSSDLTTVSAARRFSDRDCIGDDPALPRQRRQLELCHGHSNGGGRFLDPDAVVDPSHRCSPLKESRALTIGAVAKESPPDGRADDSFAAITLADSATVDEEEQSSAALASDSSLTPTAAVVTSTPS